MTALDYVGTLGEEVLNKYKATVDSMFQKGVISKTKRDFLLMKEEDIPSDFLNRDLAESQYIARYAISMLKEVVRTVSSTTGYVTDRLREDWGLVDVMKELNWDKYDKLGLTEIRTDRNGRKIKHIKDWTKRNDHRHHAMDALVIAFTKPSFIQYLNNLKAHSNKSSSIYAIQQKELEMRDKRLRFKAPMDLKKFRREAKRHLSEIFVSMKPKGKVATKSQNKTMGHVQETLTPRGEFFKNAKYYRRIINSENSVEMFVRRENITPKLNIQDVIDIRIRQILQERLDEYAGNAQKAFSNLDENPIWFNREKGIVIKTVTVNKHVKSAFAIHNKRDHRSNVTRNEFVDYVETKENHHAEIYIDVKGNLQEHIVTFFEAVERKRKGLPVIDKNFNAEKGWTFLFSIRKNEYFVFPNKETGFYPEQVNLLSEKYIPDILDNLFYAKSFSSNDYEFKHHLDASNSEIKDVTWKRLRSPKGLKGIVKVRINHIGQIVQVGE